MIAITGGPTRLRAGCVAALFTAAVGVVLPAAASGAGLVPLSSTQVACPASEFGTSIGINLSAAMRGASTAIYSISSAGADAFVSGKDLSGSVTPGEQIWDKYGNLAAGETPFVTVSCSAPGGGTVTITLYAAPTAPATFSVVSRPGQSLFLPFQVPGEAEYVADVNVSQGAVRVSGTVNRTVSRSQQVPLGRLTRGIKTVFVTAQGSPLSAFSITIRARPITITNLRFRRRSSRPANVLNADYTLNGSTRITAVINNARGRTIRSLGSFNRERGRRSVRWNGRTGNGGRPANGTYRLVLTSRDPLGNVRRASTPIIIDGQPPRINPVARRLRPTQRLSPRITDTGSGVTMYAVRVDGQQRARRTFINPRRQALPVARSPRGGWLPGQRRFEIVARDQAGNTVTRRGTFTVPIGGRRIVLGRSDGFGAGWGQVRPAFLSYLLATPERLLNVRWQSWGGFTARGTATGDYSGQLARVELRATRIGRCTANGPLAYRRVFGRVAQPATGRFGPWSRWARLNDSCD